MTKQTISLSKQYRTRAGNPVRIYAVDGGGQKPIHGSIETSDGYHPQSWTREGEYLEGIESPHDLVEVKPRIKRDFWVNVYNTDWAMMHRTQESAVKSRMNSTCIATVKVTLDFEEGDGL